MPDSLFRFGTGLSEFNRVNHRARAIPWVRLSKIEYYHSDNLSTIRLSDVKHAVNKERRFGRVV